MTDPVWAIENNRAVYIPVPDEPVSTVVILDRIEAGVTPDYCTHGRATCVACPEWVWLGDETHNMVRSGQALPLCVQCAHRLIGPDTPRAGHVDDHRRADGPH